MSAPAPLLARFGEFQLDEADARLSRAGAPVELPPRAFAVLCTLLRTPGQLVPKELLLDAVWGHRHVSESVLKTTISQLRGALADDAKQPRYIETASRRGYRFIAALGPPATAAAPVPGPPVPAGPAPPGLIARDGPLALLQEAFAAAQRGRRQLMLLAGEAGIGKSTLIDRFVAGLPGGAQHALGQCVEHYGSAEPYMPVLEALNLLCRGADGAELLALMRRVAPTWLAQLPWFLADADRQALQREVAGATQDRMLREFGELLDRRSAERALVLVLEDLHWSDHATVQLLAYLARRRSPAALMVLASFRPAEVIAEEHPLAGARQELRLHRLCREIDLEAFSEAELGALLALRLGDASVPEDFVRALHAHTEGLPLYVVNVIDELLEQGALRRGPDGAWQFPAAARFGMPQHLVGVVEKQIARLPPPLQRVLAAASVAGAEFLHLPLAEVLNVDPEALQAQLDAAPVRQHWLRPAGALTLPDGRIAASHAFRHALYRHVFYQRSGAAQRMQWHRAFAAALQRLHGPRADELAAELALHLERGGDARAAAGQLARAAGRALARSAAREALQAARHALQLLAAPAGGADAAPDDALELELRLLEGVALTRLELFSAPAVGAAFERACVLGERVGDAALHARALHGLWWARYARCELDEAHALARRILALADPQCGDGRLRLAGLGTSGITQLMLGDHAAARRDLEAALALCGDGPEELPPGLFVQHPGVEIRAYLAVAAWWSGAPAAARRHAAEAVALARTIRHPISQVIALHMAAVLHYFAGDYAQAQATAGEVAAVIREHGLPQRPGAFSWLHGHVTAALGDAQAGLAAMQAARRSCEELQMRIGLTGFYLHHAEACHETGRPDEAQASVAQGIALAEAGPERFLLAALLRVQATLQQARGEPEAAAATLQRALAVARAQGAAFHELRALVDAAGLPGFPAAALRGRLRELLAGYGDEEIAVVRRARALAAA